MKTRTVLLNRLIRSYGFRRYLEIGVDNPENNFNKIACEWKLGVDPATLHPAVHRTTSDAFFDTFALSAKWSLIFIDGDHNYAQCRRDLCNALKHLTPNGMIVMHDVNPQSEQEQLGTEPKGIWLGQCWKVFVEARMRTDLWCTTYPFDHGCGLIRHREPKDYDSPLQIEGELTYERLVENRSEWLNFVPEIWR